MGTPTKITWKIPKPLPVGGISIDKLEMDKSGVYAAEVALTDALHTVKGLSVTAKSDLVNPQKVAGTFTYTGLPNTRIQLDTKLTNPADCAVELTTSALKNFTFGAKMSPKSDKLPNLGLHFAEGNLFFALVASGNLQNIKAHKMFKVNDDLKLAATTEKSLKDKGPPKFTAGLLFNLAAFDTKLKAKVSQDMTVCVSAKKPLAKGFTLLAGSKYNPAKKTPS